MADAAPTPNPMFNANKLKLGTFGTNGRGGAQTLVPEAHRPHWPVVTKAAELADQIGFEALVPFARWKGFVPNNPEHTSSNVLDTFIWAAALSQLTRQIAVFATSHAVTVHPLVAAKQAATIDVISGGRFGLNVVGGWNRPELEMFGNPLKEHTERYDHLAEWLTLVERLWTEDDEFDHDGRFFTLKGALSRPRPLQQPRPVIMNAGGSATGRRFAARAADVCLVLMKSEDPDQCRGDIEDYRGTARDEFGRKVQVWTTGTVVQRDTQAEAEAYLKHFAVDHADKVAVDTWIAQHVNSKSMAPDVLEKLRMRIGAGIGGFPLIGTAERIAERLAMLSSWGIDGVIFTFIDYVDGLSRFRDGVLPLLEEMGLRRPFQPDAADAETATMPPVGVATF